MGTTGEGRCKIEENRWDGLNSSTNQKKVGWCTGPHEDYGTSRPGGTAWATISSRQPEGRHNHSPGRESWVRLRSAMSPAGRHKNHASVFVSMVRCAVPEGTRVYLQRLPRASRPGLGLCRPSGLGASRLRTYVTELSYPTKSSLRGAPAPESQETSPSGRKRS